MKGSDLNLGLVLKNAQKLAVDNAPVILTAAGVVGTVATAIFTGKSAYKAAQIIKDAEHMNNLNRNEPDWAPLDNKDKIQLTWKLYAVPVSTGVVAVASIVFANRISTKRAAALAAAYSLSERAFHEYKGKVLEHIGENKERKVRDEVAQDKLKKNPVSAQSGQIIMTGGGDQLCLDGFSGRYFFSDMESIRKAVNDINQQIHHSGSASLSDFYEKLGLHSTDVSDEVGFSYELPLDIDYTSGLSDDGRPCIVMTYRLLPNAKFDRLMR